MAKLVPKISLPGEKAIGQSSPVQQTLTFLRNFLSSEPTPDIDTASSKSGGLLVGNHLLHLISACGLLHGSGFHSAAITLLRPLEDALDCFAAVTLVKGAAENWSSRNLKPSDAAKLWTATADDLFAPSDGTLPEYRKTLRGQFAHYMHCSYDLCLWDLFFNPQACDPKTGQMSGTFELNQRCYVIDQNAHAIDAHLTAHLLEVVEILNRAYSQALKQEPARFRELERLENEIIEIMDQHNKHKCQEVRVPPEWRRGNP